MRKRHFADSEDVQWGIILADTWPSFRQCTHVLSSSRDRNGRLNILKRCAAIYEALCDVWESSNLQWHSAENTRNYHWESRHRGQTEGMISSMVRTKGGINEVSFRQRTACFIITGNRPGWENESIPDFLVMEIKELEHQETAWQHDKQKDIPTNKLMHRESDITHSSDCNENLCKITVKYG